MNIHFTQPLYLWLLIAIPLFIFTHFALLRYNHYKALKFANFYALKRVTGQKLITKNITILLIRTFSLLFLILALTQPFLRYTTNVGSYDYVLALDVSASMSATDFPPTRLAVAKTSAQDFLTALPIGSQLGLIHFSGSTFVDTPLERSKLLLAKDISNINLVNEGGTDIPGAIITSTNLLINSVDGRAIIILTDGSNTVGTFLEDSIQQAVNYANTKNVRIYTIGIGSESGPIGYLPEYYNISATYNANNLQLIANATGGKYFSAGDYQNLTEAYSLILKDSGTGIKEVELSFGLVTLTLILLFVEWGLINTRFKRNP